MARKSKGFSGGGGGGNGLAQSGGINRTFGGGKGGQAKLKADTAGRKIGTGRMANGLTYAVRVLGGNFSRAPFKGTVGSPPPLRGGPATTRIKRVTVRGPHIRGGSK